MSEERTRENPAQLIEDAEPEDRTVSETQQKAEDLEKEKADLYDRLLRKQAELENYRKRVEKEKGEIRQRARSAVVTEFLSVLDSTERGLRHLQQLEEGTAEVEQYRQGLELIYKQVRAIFDSLGVKEIPTKGEQFNPRMHEAVQRQESHEHRDSEVLEEIRKGYTLNDQLLRPAQVKVAVRPDQ